MEIDILNYQNYRTFLKDFYDLQKKQKSSFSYRSFSKYAGLASPAHLLLVMKGQKNLGPSSLLKFTKGLKFKGVQKEYFEALVSYNQSEDFQEKLNHFSKMQKLKAKSSKIPQEKQQSFYKAWYLPLLYEYVICEGFIEDPDQISAAFFNKLSPKEVELGLQLLLEQKMLTKDSKGQLKQSEVYLNSEDEVENLLIRQYHKKMWELTLEKINEPVNQREFGSLVISLDEEHLQKLKLMIKNFLNTTNMDMTQQSKKKKVYHLGIQLIQISQ